MIWWVRSRRPLAVVIVVFGAALASVVTSPVVALGRADVCADADARYVQSGQCADLSAVVTDVPRPNTFRRQGSTGSCHHQKTFHIRLHMHSGTRRTPTDPFRRGYGIRGLCIMRSETTSPTDFRSTGLSATRFHRVPTQYSSSTTGFYLKARWAWTPRRLTGAPRWPPRGGSSRRRPTGVGRCLGQRPRGCSLPTARSHGNRKVNLNSAAGRLMTRSIFSPP